MNVDRRLIQVLLTCLSPALAWSFADGNAVPPAPEGFTVRHEPAAVTARARLDPAGGATTYVWMFRTEVRNDFPFPLRIVRFAFEATGPDGLPLPGVTGRAFTAKEFSEWYTAGAPVRDGWLGPGQAAADTSNWNRSSLQIAPHGRWYYVAVDSSGAEYRAEAPADLCPFKPADEPWAGVAASGRVPVALSVTWPGGTVPAMSQLRFERLVPDPRLPTPAVYAWEGGSMPYMEAAVPGLYRIHAYIAGCEPMSRVVLLTETDGPLTLAWDAAPLGEVAPAPNLDSAHAWLADAWSLQERVEETSARYRAEAQAWSIAHGSQEGFTFDWAPMQAEVGVAMATGSPESLRRYAAWVAATAMPVPDAAAAGRIVDLLPPSSPLWAAGPEAALGAAFGCGRLLGRDLVAPLAAENPDRYVRARAVAAQALAAWERGDAAALAPLRERLVGEFADVRSVDRERARVATMARVVTGQRAPDFRVRDLDSGAELTNADFAGRWLLVHFWATWCGFCKQEMPQLHAAVDAYGKRGLEILSLSLDQRHEEVAKYRDGPWKMPWKHAWLGGGTSDGTARAFEVEGVPRLVLVGPDGMIAATDAGLRGAALDSTLARWLEGN